MPEVENILREVAAEYLNTIPATRSDNPKAFIETVVTWIGGWWKLKDRWQSITPGYCAFLLQPDFARSPLPEGFELITMFRDAPASNIGGAIYVCDYALKKVCRLRGDFPDANAIVATVKANGLTNVPSVLFDPEAGTLIISYKGAASRDAIFQLHGLDAALTVANIDRILQSLYDSSLRYPTDFPHMWRNAAAFVPIFYAEKFFQSLVFLQLKAVTQKTCVVVKEDHTNAGRTDITIYSYNPQCTFVLEFKVLKTFEYEPAGRPTRPWSLADNCDWAIKGVEQLIGYKTARDASEAFLILYDLRKTGTALKRVIVRCTKEAIKLRKYFIYNATPASLRKKKAKRALSRTR